MVKRRFLQSWFPVLVVCIAGLAYEMLYAWPDQSITTAGRIRGA